MPFEARKHLCQLPCGRALLQQRVQQLVLVYQCVLYGAVAHEELVVGQNFHDVVEAAAFYFRPVIVAGCDGAVALCQPVLRRGYRRITIGQCKGAAAYLRFALHHFAKTKIQHQLLRHRTKRICSTKIQKKMLTAKLSASFFISLSFLSRPGSYLVVLSAFLRSNTSIICVSARATTS